MLSAYELPVSNEKINKVETGEEKVAGEVLKVQLVPLWIVEDGPVDDGDHEWEWGGDVGEHPEDGEGDGEALLLHPHLLLGLLSSPILIALFPLRTFPLLRWKVSSWHQHSLYFHLKWKMHILVMR